MKQNLSFVLCVLIPLLLVTPDPMTTAESPVDVEGSLSATAPPPPFELPSNLPVVEAIHPLSEAAKDRLRANGFVVLPDVDIERLSSAYFNLFDMEQISVFIPSDVALHLFHNVFDDLLAEVEKDHLYDDVEWLVQEVYTASVASYTAISDTYPLSKEAARHDVLVFAVAACLLDDSFVPPDYVEPDASQYVQKVLEHTVTEFYPGDDYTQYEPRGHYAGDEQLERYFRAVKWLGRRIFRIEDKYYPDDADVELTAAALLAQIVNDDPDIKARWEKVYDVTRLLAGPADSITPLMVQQALDNVFGPSFTVDMLEDEANRAALRAEFERDVYPTSEIIPVPLEFPDQIPPKYVQFLGERYLPDAEAMQKTGFPHVPTRFLPSGLDVMATVLASDRAVYWLADDIAAHPGLDTQLDSLRAQFDAYTVITWTKSTYNGWLYSLRPLLQPMSTNAPAFMQGAAWQDKELNTALGSWTQLRHDFILYGKQTMYPAPYAEGPGLVEPAPDTFGRLADLCDQVYDALDGYSMLPEAHGNNLDLLADELRTWQGYAQKVADGDWLDEWEQTYIHEVGLWLLYFFDVYWGEEHVEEKSPMLVADVASDSNTGRVLHEGTGLFNPLIVIYTPPGGEPIAGIGYVFSHYEFAEPDWNRLSDAEWETRLQENPPPRPVWTSSFLPGLNISKRVSSDLVEPGDFLTYTITVQNAGISDTPGVTITDNIPAHTVFAWADPGGSLVGNRVQWRGKTISASGSLTVSFAISVTNPLPDGIVIKNDDYSVTWSKGVSAIGAPVTTTVESMPVLSITKVGSPNPVQAGDPLTYTIVVENTGHANATGVTITDTLPTNATFARADSGGTLVSNKVQWTDKTLNTGSSLTVSFAVSVTSPLTDGILITNDDYGVTCSEGVSAVGAPVTTTVESAPVLSIAKMGSPDPVQAGGLLTYTIVAKNTGNANATGVTITDTLPTNTAFAWADSGGMLVSNKVEWTDKTLNASNSLTVTFAVSVTSPLPDGIVIMNDDYGVTCSEEVSVVGTPITTTVESMPILSIAKVENLDPVQAGSLLTYTIAAENTGNANATGVTITDTLPTNTALAWADSGGTLASNKVQWTDKTLNAGSSLTVTFAVSVTSSLPDGIVITNDDYGVTCSEGVSAVGAPVTTTVTSTVPSVKIDFNSEATLIYTDTQSSPTIIHAPAKAVTEATILAYTPVETVTVPSGFIFAAHAFDLRAYRNGDPLPGFTFEKPITITIHYSNADVTGLDETRLELNRWDEASQAWVDAACGPYHRHLDENWLSAPICHLSRFALYTVERYRMYLPTVMRN